MKVTSLVYLRRGNEVLLLHRVGSRKQEGVDENAGKWVGLGGKLLAGESAEACARREVAEESGLTALHLDYRAVITFRSDEWGEEEMHLFTCDSFSGEMGRCDEGELHWIPLDRYLSLPMWEGDRIFLTRMADPAHPFFRLTLTYEGERLASAVLDGRGLEKRGEEWV